MTMRNCRRTETIQETLKNKQYKKFNMESGTFGQELGEISIVKRWKFYLNWLGFLLKPPTH